MTRLYSVPDIWIEETRISEWEKARDEVDLYKEQLKSIEDRIDAMSGEIPEIESRGPLFGEMLNSYYKLKAAELDFFSIMDTLCG